MKYTNLKPQIETKRVKFYKIGQTYLVDDCAFLVTINQRENASNANVVIPCQ